MNDFSRDAAAWDGVDDADLARRIAAAPGADAGAESELCRRLGRRARLYGLRHLRDRHAAADLAQQVMLMTLERLRKGKLREAERLGSFVLGMCRRVVVDLRRTQLRRERLLETFPLDLPAEETEMAPRLDHERLEDCLRALPARDRSVLVMTFYDERPACDVATELGLKEGNVRVIRHRGLQRLRRCIDAGGDA